MTAAEIKDKTGIHEKPLYDFLDSLVVMGFLIRSGLKEEAVYSNSESSGTYLVEGKELYIGGRVIYIRDSAYNYWG
jgi:hypothetical protein